MALYSVSTGKVPLTAAATKTLILYKPSVARVKLRAVTISLDGSAAATAVQFDWVRATTLGTPAGTAATSVLTDEQDNADPNTGHLTALTTEPTTYAVIDSIFLQPLGGALKDWQPYGAEALATKANGQSIGIRYTTASGVSPDCICTGYFEV